MFGFVFGFSVFLLGTAGIVAVVLALPAYYLFGETAAQYLAGFAVAALVLAMPPAIVYAIRSDRRWRANPLRLPSIARRSYVVTLPRALSMELGLGGWTPAVWGWWRRWFKAPMPSSTVQWHVTVDASGFVVQGFHRLWFQSSLEVIDLLQVAITDHENVVCVLRLEFRNRDGDGPRTFNVAVPFRPEDRDYAQSIAERLQAVQRAHGRS